MGISYAAAFQYSRPELFLQTSTWTDVNSFTDLLINTFGYEASHVTIMADRDGYIEPTHDKMLYHMELLVSSAAPGDHLVFYFSGHGSQLGNGPGIEYELDHMDEAIWPSDVSLGETGTNENPFGGMIVDDVIREKLVIPAVTNGAQIVIIFDCCHSGTAADLDSTRPPPRTSALYPGAFDGDNSLAVSWAASGDSQIALGGPDSGFFTGALVPVLQHADPTTSHKAILDLVTTDMQSALQKMIDSNENWTQEKKESVAGLLEGFSEPQIGFLNNDTSLMTTLPVLGTFESEGSE